MKMFCETCQSMKFRLKLGQMKVPNILYHFGHFSRVGLIFFNKKNTQFKKIGRGKKNFFTLLKIKILKENWMS